MVEISCFRKFVHLPCCKKRVKIGSVFLNRFSRYLYMHKKRFQCVFEFVLQSWFLDLVTVGLKSPVSLFQGMSWKISSRWPPSWRAVRVLMTLLSSLSVPSDTHPPPLTPLWKLEFDSYFTDTDEVSCVQENRKINKKKSNIYIYWNARDILKFQPQSWKRY